MASCSDQFRLEGHDRTKGLTWQIVGRLRDRWFCQKKVGTICSQKEVDKNILGRSNGRVAVGDKQQLATLASMQGGA